MAAALKAEAHGLSYDFDVIHPHVGEGPAVRKRSWAGGFVVVAFYAVIISVGALVVVGLVVGLLLKGS